MQKIRANLIIIPLVFIVLTSLTGCYRMPETDEYSVIPATNNPDVCGGSSSPSLIPGAGF